MKHLLTSVDFFNSRERSVVTTVATKSAHSNFSRDRKMLFYVRSYLALLGYCLYMVISIYHLGFAYVGKVYMIESFGIKRLIFDSFGIGTI